MSFKNTFLACFWEIFSTVIIISRGEKLFNFNLQIKIKGTHSFLVMNKTQNCWCCDWKCIPHSLFTTIVSFDSREKWLKECLKHRYYFGGINGRGKCLLRNVSRWLGLTLSYKIKL